MSEREDSRPSCPECRTKDAARLAPSDTLERWQCRSFDCLHQFTIPRERPTPRLDAVMSDRRLPSEAEVLRMADSALICGKCDRKFVHPKRKTNHEETCKGPKAAAAPARSPRRPSPPPGQGGAAGGRRRPDPRRQRGPGAAPGDGLRRGPAAAPQEAGRQAPGDPGAQLRDRHPLAADRRGGGVAA